MKINLTYIKTYETQIKINEHILKSLNIYDTAWKIIEFYENPWLSITNMKLNKNI